MIRSSPPPRRGTAYLLVVIVAMTVTTVGLAAITVTRLQTSIAMRDADRRQAKALAQSGVELGLRVIQDEAVNDAVTWRATLKTNDLDVSPVYPIGTGTAQYMFENHRGGAMSTDPAEPVYVVGEGRVGSTVQRLRTVVRPSGEAYNALGLALFAHDAIVLNPGVIVQADGTLGSNGDVAATSASVFPAVAAHGQITGGTYHNTAIPYAAIRGVPGNDALDYYLTGGTAIPGTALPGNATQRWLEECVLGPEVNPFGPVDPEGIYVIDLDGASLEIRDVRIVGTLVLRNVGAGTEIRGSVNWAPAVQNFPALLVEGGTPVALALTSSDLDEAVVGVNFNPTGTPYYGQEDAVADDKYPSVIRGLIFTEDDFILEPTHTMIEGCVLAKGAITSVAGALIEVAYNPLFAEDPPPGFFVPDGHMRIAAFSWSHPLE